MLYRLIGKLVFLFYIVPFIVDTLRLVRKHTQPKVIEMIQDATKKMTNDLIDIVTEPPTSRTE